MATREDTLALAKEGAEQVADSLCAHLSETSKNAGRIAIIKLAEACAELGYDAATLEGIKAPLV